MITQPELVTSLPRIPFSFPIQHPPPRVLASPLFPRSGRKILTFPNSRSNPGSREQPSRPCVDREQLDCLPCYKGADTAATKRAFCATRVLKRQYFTLTLFTVNVHWHVCCCTRVSEHPCINCNLVSVVTSFVRMDRHCNRQLQQKIERFNYHMIMKVESLMQRMVFQRH